MAALVPSLLAAQGEQTVTRVDFRGNRALDNYTLATSIATSGSSTWYQIPLLKHLGLGQRRFFDEQEFRRDVVRLRLLYRQRGFYEAQIDTMVRRSGGSMSVTFRIVEGPPVLVDTIAVRGDLGPLDEHRILRRIPLAVGRPLDRLAFQAAADTIASLLQNRGYPFVQVYRTYRFERATQLATVEYEVMPGPRARVGDIVIRGAGGLGERTVRRSLAVQRGDWFDQSALYESQRSLYQTDLFRYVAVGIARDSVVGGTDSLVRVLVQVHEGPRARVRGGFGYGTIDCFRAQATWTAGNFLGGGRRLEVAGKVSKLGVGYPAGLGLSNSACAALADDQFSDTVNYLASMSLTQPAVFARRNALTLSAFAERRSEFNAYERTGLGGAAAMTFGVGRDVPLTLTYGLSYGRTTADPAVFCTYFDRCEESAIAPLGEPRRQATLSLAATRNRANSPIDPTAGSVLALELTHASPTIGSDSLMVFNKVTAEGTWYGRIGRAWVLAARLRGGVVRPGSAFVRDTGIHFVQPEERFYAGGPATVRGFGRNEMGPVVYVADRADTSQGGEVTYRGLRTSPSGSYALVLANLELRFPSPIWPSRLRLAAFVDAGQVWNQRDDRLVPSGFRVTPGMGLRVGTPLGPLRLDAAYNGYDREPGSLYVTVPAAAGQPGRLELVRTDYRGPPRGASFVRRLQIHVSVGQAF